MYLNYKLNMTIHVLFDNKEPIYISNNPLNKRTNHLHMRHLLIIEYIEKGYIKI